MAGQVNGLEILIAKEGVHSTAQRHGGHELTFLMLMMPAGRVVEGCTGSAHGKTRLLEGGFGTQRGFVLVRNGGDWLTDEVATLTAFPRDSLVMSMIRVVVFSAQPLVI